MDAASNPLELLRDDLLYLILERCSDEGGWESLSLTCQRLCRLVRTSRRFDLQLGLQHIQRLQQVPAARCFQKVASLCVNIHAADLQPGCWDALAAFLASSMQRWPDIQEVSISGEEDLLNAYEEMGCLAAPLAALQGAPQLRQLSLVNVAATHDLPHLEQLTQVTSLHLGNGVPADSGDEGSGDDGSGDEGSADDGSGDGDSEEEACGDECIPLTLAHPPSAPLAALTGLRCLDLLCGWRLTGEEGAGEGPDDENCPLALPPQLTRLFIARMHGTAGTLWRHIAACSALEELELVGGLEPEDGDGFLNHPTWALHELAGSLSSLKRLTLHHVSMPHHNQWQSLRQLLHMLYPAPGMEDEELFEAIQLPLCVPGITDYDTAYDRMLLPPPNMAGFSSLEVLELPGTHDASWWLMCSGDWHWRALAGCTALRQLQGLHASCPPPEEVKFPRVTDLEVTVQSGYALNVLGAFPALQRLSIYSKLRRAATQEESEASQTAEEEPAEPQLVQCSSATCTISGWGPLGGGIGGGTSSSDRDAGAAAAHCSDLWRALPCLSELELVCPPGMVLPSLTPLTGLTSLVLQLPYWRSTDMEEQAAAVPALLEVLQGATGLQKLGLRMEVAEGSWEGLAEQVHGLLPGLKDLTLRRGTRW